MLVCLAYNWTDTEWIKQYFVTLGTNNIIIVAWDFLFQDVASQWADTTLFIEKPTTTVYWLFIGHYLLS